MHSVDKGKTAEQQACVFLQSLGFEILELNVRTPFGEIDILAKTAEILVFVEVKSKLSSSGGEAIEQVTPQKLLHMTRSAQAIVQRLHWSGEYRIDLICIEQGKVTDHIQNLELS